MEVKSEACACQSQMQVTSFRMFTKSFCNFSFPHTNSISPDLIPTHGGTDVLGMKTNAVYDSSKDGYVLNGTKMWITNGTLTGKETGDLFLVYARTGSQRRSDITQFIVEGGMEGFTVGQKINDKLGMRASPTAELVFENVFLSNTHVVGEVNGAALCMMRNLEIERVALAAMAVGIARRALDEMMAYASNRPAFGKSNLFGFGQIQKHITESYAEYMAGKSYLYGFANDLDLSTYGNGLDADGVKLYCAQMSKNVSDRAIQVSQAPASKSDCISIFTFLFSHP